MEIADLIRLKMLLRVVIVPAAAAIISGLVVMRILSGTFRAPTHSVHGERWAVWVMAAVGITSGFWLLEGVPEWNGPDPLHWGGWIPILILAGALPFGLYGRRTPLWLRLVLILAGHIATAWLVMDAMEANVSAGVYWGWVLSAGTAGTLFWYALQAEAARTKEAIAWGCLTVSFFLGAVAIYNSNSIRLAEIMGIYTSTCGAITLWLFLSGARSQQAGLLLVTLGATHLLTYACVAGDLPKLSAVLCVLGGLGAVAALRIRGWKSLVAALVVAGLLGGAGAWHAHTVTQDDLNYDGPVLPY